MRVSCYGCKHSRNGPDRERTPLAVSQGGVDLRADAKVASLQTLVPGAPGGLGPGKLLFTDRSAHLTLDAPPDMVREFGEMR